MERPGAEAPALSCRPWSLRARHTELARAIGVCTPAPGPRLGSRSSFPGCRGALGPSSHRPGLGTGPQRPQRCPLVRPWERGPHARQPCPSAWPKQPQSQPAGGSRSRGVRRAVGARRGAAGLCTDSSRRRQAKIKGTCPERGPVCPRPPRWVALPCATSLPWAEHGPGPRVELWRLCDQVRILEWVAIPFSRGSSQPRHLQVCLLQGCGMLGAGGYFGGWQTRQGSCFFP